MGAPGGAVYLGRVLDWIASDLRSIIERMGRVPMGGPDAVLGDVPLLVKALGFHEDDVRADARRALARIAGEDLGPEPAPWLEWWESKGRELRERREAEVALERLFDTFQGAVMSGLWGRAAERLGFEARDHGHDVHLAEVIRRNRRALRKAWRDAGIEHIAIDGDRAKLEVSWGRLGFESRELVARRVNSEWRFESPPWGQRIIRQPRPAVHAHAARHAPRRPERMSVSGVLAVGVCVIISVSAVLMTFSLRGRAPAVSPVLFLLTSAGLLLVFAIGAVLWRGILAGRRGFGERGRAGPVRAHPVRAFPLPPRFGLALPGIAAWVLVATLAAALRHAGVEPGPVLGSIVAAAFAGPFAACWVVHLGRRREYYRALAAGEFEGWRGVALRVARSYRPGFWGTLVVASLLSLFVVMPLVFLVVACFGVASHEVEEGLVALAVVLPIPVAAGAWLVPVARNEVERRRELEGASPADDGT